MTHVLRYFMRNDLRLAPARLLCLLVSELSVSGRNVDDFVDRFRRVQAVRAFIESARAFGCSEDENLPAILAKILLECQCQCSLASFLNVLLALSAEVSSVHFS